jgi:hypothetical protein
VSDVEPCPFCGSEEIILPGAHMAPGSPSDYFIRVRCGNCKAGDPNVRVQHLRLDGTPYAYFTRGPRYGSALGRWNATHGAARTQAIVMWNRRKP